MPAPRTFVFLAAVLLYAGTLSAGFTNWDDPGYVLNNPDLPLATAAQWRSALTAPRMVNFAPVHILSYALDYRLWGLRPFGYHLTNILLQGLVAVLLYETVLAFTKRERAALLAALLFACHPVNVEVVAWVSERKTLLAAAFMLGALLAYLRAEGHRAWAWAALCVLLYALGAASKMAIAPFPIFLLVVHRATGLRLTSARGAATALCLAAAIGSGLALLRAHGGAGYLPGPFGGSIARHGGVVAEAFAHYARMLFLPVNLSPLYDFRHGLGLHAGRAALGAALAIGAFAASARLLARRRPAALWACGAILFWLPASSLIVPFAYPRADRYLYLPLLFLAPLAAVSFEQRLRGARGRLGADGSVLAGAVILLFAVLAVNQARPWRASLALWSAAVRTDPGNPWARRMLAITHLSDGRPAEAAREARIAAEILPRQLEIRELLANAELRAGNYAAAEDAFRAELGLAPGAMSALLGVARVQAARGEDRRALETYLEVLRQMRDYPEAAAGLVKLAKDRSLEREALAGLPRAPTSAPIELARGDLLLALGRRAEAVGTWRKLLLTRPDYAPARERMRALRSPRAPSARSAEEPRPPAPGSPPP